MNVAVFRIGHLGDTVIALPALWTVRRAFPRARILFMTQDLRANTVGGGEVLRTGSVFDEQLLYRIGTKGEIVQTILRLRRERIDTLVYIPSHRTPAQIRRDRLFFRLAGVKQIVGMRGYERTEYRPEGSPLPTVRHEADMLLDHLARDGVAIENPPADMGLTETEREEARAWLRSKGVAPGTLLVGVGPGSKMPAKLWPAERFAAVCEALDREFRPTFVMFGSPPERETCETISAGLSRAVNAAGELSVRGSAAVFEHCALYLGNDTGTMHLAASAGVRCVALFSARDWPGRWFPYGKGHAVHRVVVPCEGCLLETCDRGNLCLMSIETEPVVESCRTILRDALPKD